MVKINEVDQIIFNLCLCYNFKSTIKSEMVEFFYDILFMKHQI